jgi:glycine/D-amino acid oxidase-like deaminating enzyme
MQQGRPPPSFWEQDAMLDADFVVVGGGLIGLQTAIELRERRPQARVVVLERGTLPAGASSRNAGFACFGSLTEILHDIALMGEDDALGLVARRWRGLAQLRARCGDAAIGYEAHGGFELLYEQHLPALDHLDELNRKLQTLFGCPVFSVHSAALRARRFGTAVRALVCNPLEAQLHSGRLMRTLAALAARCGVELHTGVDVLALDEGDGEVRIRTGGMTFRAARVAVCTNGYTAGLLPDAGIVPARGQVVVTAPLPGLGWKGTYHLDEGFYYFRNVGERVLLGGGRNLDPLAEESTEMKITDGIQTALEKLLQDIILPEREDVRIEHRWAGVMGFSADKKPVVRSMSDRVALGFGCNGMGVALGADIAAQTAQLLL